MLLNTLYRGRLIQVVEALDFGDAVSNQVIRLDTMFRGQGFDSHIYSKWTHPSVEGLRCDLDRLKVNEDDILILHYAGYSEFAFDVFIKSRCTKICVYHNITPASFFPQTSPLFDFCSRGREQLKDVVKATHFVWGDSQYNLDEVVALGFPPEKCSVVPIVVDADLLGAQITDDSHRYRGSWVFVSRIAANKAQVDLVRLFSDVHDQAPEKADRLLLVGNFNPSDAYYQELVAAVAASGLSDRISITGKVSEAELVAYLAEAEFYVSLSAHEGFGVPLIEAALFGVPVMALASSAIGETLGGHGVADTVEHLKAAIISSDSSNLAQLRESQIVNAKRFSEASVQRALNSALSNALPSRLQFTTVSIVICTYNRADLLERCLDYLQYQTNTSFEVIVINGPSTDHTDDIISSYSGRLKVGRIAERNLAKARNLGIELSDGQLIAFIDDDALPFDDWVSALLKEFSERPLTLAAVGGPAYYAGSLRFQAEDIAINELAESKFHFEPEVIGQDGWMRSMLGTNTCFRADILKEVGGFDEQFDYFLDESEVSYRLQKKNYIVGYGRNVYLRHEFAQSANRNSKYGFNWYSIVKNTVYFICAYSAKSQEELHTYIEDRIDRERVKPLEAAALGGEISPRELEEYKRQIARGIEDGFQDFQAFPKLRTLSHHSSIFLPFAAPGNSSLIGRDTRALHVCILTKEFPPFVPGGGIGTLYYHLASELLLMGHYVSVVVPGEESHVFTQGRFSVHYVAQLSQVSDIPNASGFVRNTNWSVSALKAIAELHSRYPIDVVDTALWDAEGLALSLIPSDSRPPLVVRLVTPFAVAAEINSWNIHEKEREFFNAAEKALITHADVVIPISKSIGSTVRRIHNLAEDMRWVQSYCGVAYWATFDHASGYSDLTKINGQPFSIGKDAKLVLFLGRLETRKGIDLVLKAAEVFLASDATAHLVLAGKDVEGWRSRSQDGIYRERIHFIGEVDDMTREKLLGIAYCVLFPSRYESFGLVPLEAFVHGTPVVAAKAGAIPEVVPDGICGLLFDTESSDGLAKCVTSLLKDEELHRRLSTGALKQIRKFSSRNSAIETVKVYLSALSAKVSIERFLPERFEFTCNNENGSVFQTYSGFSLSSVVGERRGNVIHTTGTAGFLTYGPYLRLEPGNYRAKLYAQVSAIGEQRPYVEVITTESSVPLTSSELSVTEKDGLVVELAFPLSIRAQIEVRVWVHNDTEMTVSKLIVAGVEDNSPQQD